MTRDDIIRMAREAGMDIDICGGVEEVGCGDGYHLQTDLIERFAVLVAEAERAECIKIAEDHAADKTPAFKAYENTFLDGWLDASNEIGWAIRARGEK